MVVQSPHLVESSIPTAKNGRKRVKIQLGNGSPASENVPGQRRSSARLQAAKQRAEKELLTKRKVNLPVEDGSSSRKKINVDAENLKLKHAQTEVQQLPETSPDPNPTEPKMNERVAKMVERAAKISEGLDCSNAPSEKSAHIKVKETIRLFNKHYLHFVQVCLCFF